MDLPKRRRVLNSFQIIVLGFAGVILLGALLLMLPVSSASGSATPFVNALFTSTTSVCVTGLVVYDTATYWSGFGHAVILVLIQIGGMGVVTVAASFAMISGRKIGLFQRSTMQEAMAAPKMSGIVRLTNFIVRTTILIELLGAAVMAPVFCRDFGVGRGLWMALFHSVGNPVINIAVMLLIVIGGIGFLTWDDVRTNRLHLKRYRMQSKVILCTTAVLIVLPALYFYFCEFADFAPGKRVLASLFQSVTPRTAGFNTVDLAAMSEPGQALTILLMLIGGSPGSTAGGMKTTTVAVLAVCAVAVFRRRGNPEVSGRSIALETVANAATILLMYAALCFTGGMVISCVEQLPMLTCLYESASAIGTVGLSLGITPSLKTISKAVLIVLMFFGRVGGLTLIYAAMSRTVQNGKLPQEKITVG